MKKFWCALFVVGILLLGAVPVFAQPDPVYQVEMVRKPGIDFRQFKSVGSDVSISLDPNSDWAIDKKDSFLEQRIQTLSLKAAKKQGWIPTENTYADLKLSVKVLEWGRLRNSADQNLMEFVNFELKVYSSASEGPIFRASGRYSRVDPEENDLAKVADAYSSILEDMLAALHKN